MTKALLTRSLSAGLLAAAFAAAPASALPDLTGNWEGSLVCDTLDATGSDRIKSGASIAMDDDGSGTVYAYLNNSLLTFHLTVVADPDAPAQGRVAGGDCNISPANGGSLLQLTVKAKDASDKGSMKGEFLTVRVGANPHSVQVCKVKLKRTSTTILTPIEGCPL